MQTDKTVDRESLEKLYVQMDSIIKAKIESREWPAGSQIPTEDELCQAYDVSKATVRMAIAELVRHGYLKKQQGRGTFDRSGEGLARTDNLGRPRPPPPRPGRHEGPKVLIREFADNGINLELAVWIRDAEEGQLNLSSDLYWAIWRAFKAEGNEIPFPQRVVYLVQEKTS